MASPILDIFFEETEELLELLAEGLPLMQGAASDKETVNSVIRAVHAITGGAGAFKLTYPKANDEAQVETFLSGARDLCVADLDNCEVISNSGTPSLAMAGQSPCIMEYRAGTYIYNDRSLIAHGSSSVADCALTVLTTVVVRPTADHGILGAGSKSLTSDLFELTGYGLIPACLEAFLSGLSEEHGHLDLRLCDGRPKIGEKLQVIPNHACPVSNLVDQVVFHRGGKVVRFKDVAARGCVT